VVDRIIRLLYRFRRGEKPADGGAGQLEDYLALVDWRELHRDKLEYFVQRFEPIHFVLPAFPAKSPNQTKVLGSLPDLGEHLALSFLQSLCDYVNCFHPPGARLTICSDGHVFGDVVGVTDRAVTEYREQLAGIIEKSDFASLELFGLDDAFGGDDYPKLRKILESDYARPVSEVKEDIRTSPAAQSLFNGIHRFMFEDAVGTRGDVSRTALRNETKETAYHTISRSNAWSRVVADRFPEAVRLSIHPQPPNSEKIGIRLLPARDSWLTPWHGVVLDDGGKVSLVKRWEAEKLSALMMWRNGRPSHFVGPHLSYES